MTNKSLNEQKAMTITAIFMESIESQNFIWRVES